MEKEEGPWFRTPKTGMITDTFLRGQFFKFFKFISTSRPKVAPVQTQEAFALGPQIYRGPQGSVYSHKFASNSFSFASIPSSYHFLSGHRLLGRRRPLAARGIIAILLVLVMSVNYLAFFAQTTNAAAPTGPRLEQQINIMDQEYSTNSTSYVPTDKSLGLVTYNSANFDPDPTIYFEAILKGTGANSRGKYTSLKLNSSGYPVVSYYDETNGDLIVLACDDANCAGDESANISAPDTAGDIGLYTSLVLDQSSSTCTSTPKNCPVISYYEATYANLKVLHCTNNACSGSQSPQFPDQTDVVGLDTSIVLNSSGYPIVSYYDVTDGDLNVLFCGNAICTSGNTVLPLDGCSTCNTNGDVGKWSSIGIGTSNLLRVAYFSVADNKLKLAKCSSTCTSISNWTFSSASTTNEGQETSLAMYGDVAEVAGYSPAQTPYYGVYVWTNDLANRTPLGGTLDTENEGLYTSSAVYSGNLEVVYYNQTTGDLDFSNCSISECSSGSKTRIDSTGDVGQYTSIAIDSSGYPVISYYDATNQTLKIAHCNDSTCNGETINSPDTAGSGTTATAALYTEAGSEVSGSAVTSETSSSYKLYRSSAITLSDTNYTVRLKSSFVSTTIFMKSARIILIQCGGTCSQGALTTTETQVEVGDYFGITGAAYANLTKMKFYYFENKWNPVPEGAAGSAYFEATLKAGSGGTAYARLYNKTEAELVTNGEVSTTTSANYVLQTTRSGTEMDICTVAVECSANQLRIGDICGAADNEKCEYVVQTYYATATGAIANAKIIIDQVDTTNGVTNLQTYQQYNNSDLTITTNVYTSQNYDNQFTQDNFSGTKNFYFESTLTGISTGKTIATSYAQLYNKDNSDAIDTPTASEVSNTTATPARFRSSNLANNTDWPDDPNTSKKLDVQIKNSDNTSGVYNYNSWLIIEITNLNVPEKVLFLIPVMLFLPVIIKKFKAWREKRLAYAEVHSMKNVL
jgi:hypothetical protein